jgi:hypothetical protein
MGWPSHPCRWPFCLVAQRCAMEFVSHRGLVSLAGLAGRDCHGRSARLSGGLICAARVCISISRAVGIGPSMCGGRVQAGSSVGLVRLARLTGSQCGGVGGLVAAVTWCVLVGFGGGVGWLCVGSGCCPAGVRVELSFLAVTWSVKTLLGAASGVDGRLHVADVLDLLFARGAGELCPIGIRSGGGGRGVSCPRWLVWGIGGAIGQLRDRVMGALYSVSRVARWH